MGCSPQGQRITVTTERLTQQQQNIAPRCRGEETSTLKYSHTTEDHVKMEETGRETHIFCASHYAK